MVKKVLIVIVSVLIASLIFMPKKELYFALEHKLVDFNIKINEGSINDTLFGLEITDADLYAQGIKVAHISNIDFTTLFIYNSISMSDISVDSSLKSMAPQNIANAKLTYSIISPLKVKISSNGDFGKVEGYLDFNKTVYLEFIEVGDIKPFIRGLKKNDNGWYYEKRF